MLSTLHSMEFDKKTCLRQPKTKAVNMRVALSVDDLIYNYYIEHRTYPAKVERPHISSVPDIYLFGNCRSLTVTHTFIQNGQFLPGMGICDSPKMCSYREKLKIKLCLENLKSITMNDHSPVNNQRACEQCEYGEMKLNCFQIEQ